MEKNDFVDFIFSETKKVFEEVGKETGSKITVGSKPDTEKPFEQKAIGFRLKKAGKEITLNIMIEYNQSSVLYLSPGIFVFEVKYHSIFKNKKEYEKELIIIAAFLRRHLM